MKVICSKENLLEGINIVQKGRNQTKVPCKYLKEYYWKPRFLL
jgi:hypothetical protein